MVTFHPLDYAMSLLFKGGQGNLFGYVDSVGKASDGMNLYQYAGGNPVNYRDPYGLFTSPAGLAGELATGVGGILLLTGTAPTVGTVLLVGGVGLIAYDMISSMSDAQEQGNRLGKWYKKIMDDYYKKIDKIENKVCPINRMR